MSTPEEKLKVLRRYADGLDRMSKEEEQGERLSRHPEMKARHHTAAFFCRLHAESIRDIIGDTQAEDGKV